MKVLVATRNAGKVRELQRLLDGSGFELVGLDAFGDAPDVVEDGDTFEANALKKAREMAAHAGLPTLADDSGIEADVLDLAPGIHSARYAGVHGDDEANNDKLLAELADVPDAQRTGRFVCALAFVDLDRGFEHVARGTIEGVILRERRGEGGFGYDPLFLPHGHARTTAEMSAAEKNAISHRANAAALMLNTLRERYLT